MHPMPHRRRAPRLTEADPEDGAAAFSAAQGHQGASAGLLQPWGVWGRLPAFAVASFRSEEMPASGFPPFFFH